MRLFGMGKKDVDVVDFNDEGMHADSELFESSDFDLATVGPYEIVARVGSGGMGTVYKAVDKQRDRTIAVKVLDKQYDEDRTKRKRDYLGQEIKIAADLRHDSIIQMHPQIVEQMDRHGESRRCLLMEYIDGHNLREFINNRSLSVAQMIRICIRLAKGLDFLHQNGVVHRDVKPENFLFSRDMSKVKIVDFGLSKSNSGWRARWGKERGGGTRRYMSPEQLGKKRLDARSDIFSFGITMYELFTGRHPCTSGDPVEVMKQLRDPRFKFDPPSRHNPDLPPHLDKIILKALRRKPERRYQSMTEMLMDLNRIGESRI